MKTLTFPLILLLGTAVLASGLQHQTSQPQTWKRYAPDGCGLSLELPNQPKPQDLPPPAEAQQYVYQMKHFLAIGEDVIVVVSHVSAKAHMPPKSLAEGVIKGIVNNPAVSDLSYSTEPSTESKATIKGKYKHSGVDIEFIGTANSEGKQVWIIAALYKQANQAIANPLAERVLASIKMEGPPCPDQKEIVGYE